MSDALNLLLRTMTLMVSLSLILGTFPLLAEPRPAPLRRLSNDPTLEADIARIRGRLLNVSEESRSYRTLTGGVFLGVAALFSGAYIAHDRLLTGEPRRLALGVLGVAGGLSLAGGIFSIAFSSDYEDRTRAYLRTERWDSNIQRLAMSEALLSGFAARAKASRQLLGGFLLALGVGDVTWHFAAGNTPNTMFLVYKGALLGTLGVAFLFIPHPAELEYNFFREERRFDREETPSGPRIGLQPLDRGALFSMAVPF